MIRVGTITVREEQGIRRFYYPLKTVVSLAEECPLKDLGLQREDGRPVPIQATRAAKQSSLVRLDFAVSLDPLQELRLLLFTGAGEGSIDDPLRVESADYYRCTQQRFSVEFDRTGHVHQAIYDGKPHLRRKQTTVRNNLAAAATGEPEFFAGPLAARISVPGRYSDGCTCLTELDLTACKSWVGLTHVLSEPRSGDLISFRLPLAPSASLLTCDLGVSGGLYAKLQTESAPDITWLTDFGADGRVHWSLATGGRIDYRGDVPDREQYRSQAWFHLIDSGKALAAAITAVPAECRKMTILLRATGDTVISFQLGDVAGGAASFGICYHFLNDIPALAAATNPQSILRPPVVIPG